VSKITIASKTKIIITSCVVGVGIMLGINCCARKSGKNETLRYACPAHEGGQCTQQLWVKLNFKITERCVLCGFFRRGNPHDTISQ
jgi:hypothetical protein